VLHKHNPIIRVGAGLIQFVFKSHLRFATEATRNRNAFSPFSPRVSIYVHFFCSESRCCVHSGTGVLGTSAYADVHVKQVFVGHQSTCLRHTRCRLCICLCAYIYICSCIYTWIRMCVYDIAWGVEASLLHLESSKQNYYIIALYAII